MRPIKSEIISNVLRHHFRQASDSKLVKLAEKLLQQLDLNERRSQMSMVQEEKVVMPTTLLFVDDNINLVETATQYLGEIRPAWRFLLAHTLAEGRPIYNLYSPDAAVLDVGLPDGNGLDLLSELKRHRPGLPVIMISADDEEALRRAAMERGAYSLLIKPFSAPALVNYIESAIYASRDSSPVPIFPQPEASGAWRNPHALVLQPTNQRLAVLDAWDSKPEWLALK